MTGTLRSHVVNTVNYISNGSVSGNKASGSTGRPVSNMVKHLRADIDDKHFKRFKAFMAMEGASTNDEFIVSMLDLYEKYDNGELLTREEAEELANEMSDTDEPEISADETNESAGTQGSIEF